MGSRWQPCVRLETEKKVKAKLASLVCVVYIKQKTLHRVIVTRPTCHPPSEDLQGVEKSVTSL